MKIYVYCLFVVLFLVQNSFAKTGAQHVRDMLEVSLGENTYNTVQIRDKLHEFTKTIDNFDVITNLPVGDSGHRLYGHWGYSDKIPFKEKYLKDMLLKIKETQGEKEAELVKQRIIQSWHNDVVHLQEIARDIIGYDGTIAKGYAGVLYDIHILGDYSGKKLSSLQNQYYIVEDLKKNIHRLFGNNSNRSKVICNEIKSVYNNMVSKYGKDSPRVAEQLLFALKESNELKTGFQNLANSKSLLGKSMIKSVGYKIPNPVDITDIERTAYKLGMKNFDIQPGVMLPSGKVLVAVSSGVSSCLCVFAIDGGIATYQYLHDEMYTHEYREKLIQAAINGTAVGSATAVAVLLGSNPAGLTVMAIASGTYLIVNTAQEMYTEYKYGKLLDRDDLKAFGIEIDSILEPKIDPSIPFNADKW